MKTKRIHGPSIAAYRPDVVQFEPKKKEKISDPIIINTIIGSTPNARRR